MFTITLLVERITETIEILRTQLEGNLDPIETANVRGRINGMKAILHMVDEELKVSQQ